MRTIIYGLIIVFLATAVATFVAQPTSANETHLTSGIDSHNAGTHAINPAHVWVRFRADHSGSITSGGRWHDKCDNDDTCSPSFNGADWALDIGGSLNQTSKLYLDYGGQASGGSVTVDNNKSITITANVGDIGNFRSPARAACAWRRYDIRVSYTDTSGVQHLNEVVGWMWFAHLQSWSHALNASVSANASRPNLDGTGTIFFINGVTVGKLANGDVSDPPDGKQCSTGPHTHLEWFSRHNWGQANEWHSAGQKNIDGYNMLGFGDHVHRGGAGYSHTAPDASFSGSSPRTLGLIGGWTTDFRMADNPYYASH